MTKPKRQHLVPQMLLRRFAGDAEAGRIWQLRVDDDSDPMLVSIKDAAVVKHYYTLFRDRSHKSDDWFWEKLFAEWEGSAAKALRVLDVDPERLGRPAQLLVVLQLLRTPLGQGLLAEQAAAERQRIFGAKEDRVWARWWVRRKGYPPSMAEWIALSEAAEAARTGKEHHLLAIDATTILDEMLLVVRDSGFGERLTEEGDWNILNEELGRFVIGDEPVTYWGQHNPARPIWAQEELPQVLTMPISSSQCIEVRRDRRRSLLLEHEIEAVNLRAFEWANRFVYGPDPEGLHRLRRLWQEVGSPSPAPRDREVRRRR